MNIKLMTEDELAQIIATAKDYDVVGNILSEYPHSEKICLAGIKFDGLFIQGVENPTLEMVSTAVKQYASNFCWVDSPTEEMCMAAIEANPEVIAYIDNPTEKMCLLAVNTDPCSLFFIAEKFQTVNICLEALSKFTPNHPDYKDLFLDVKIVENQNHEITFKNLMDLKRNRIKEKIAVIK